MLNKKILTINNLSFRYDSTENYLFKKINTTFAPGWTGVIGPNGTGKTTLLRLVSGLIRPSEGGVSNNGGVVFCEQRMDSVSETMNEFMFSYDSYACRLRALLNMDVEWIDRWETLSFGERKKIQIAAAIWKEPIALCIDEPANHLDMESKKCLFNLLSLFKGTGLLVSHDREFLDELCRNCIFIEPPDISLYKGGYTVAVTKKAVDDETARNEFKIARSNYNKLKKEYSKRKHEASLADSKRSKRKIGSKDNDARNKIRAAIVTGKDGKAGRLQSQLQGRLDQYLQKLKEIRAKKIEELGIWVKGELTKKDILLRLSDGEIAKENKFILQYPDIVIQKMDRISITGNNGTGKTTFIKYIINKILVPKDKIVYIPQEICIESSKKILSSVKNLSGEKLGKVMAIVKRLGSEPERLLESRLPSPGEIRKLFLAFGILNAPEMIIMDEPTNHLDLISIECIENALLECPCSLLLISHDIKFLKKLTNFRWHIKKDENGINNLEKILW